MRFLEKSAGVQNGGDLPKILPNPQKTGQNIDFGVNFEYFSSFLDIFDRFWSF